MATCGGETLALHARPAQDDVTPRGRKPWASLRDPPAAENAIPGIEHNRLPRRDAELRFRELNTHPVSIDPFHCRFGCRVLIADLCLAREAVRNFRNQPVQTMSREFPGREVVPGPEHNALRFRFDADHETWFTESHAQSPALTDREAFITGMLAQHAAGRINEFAGGLADVAT